MKLNGGSAKLTFFLVAVTLFEPGVGMVVIASGFPKTAFVIGSQLNLGDPFGRFPGVKVVNDQAHGAPVLRVQHLSLIHI